MDATVIASIVTQVQRDITTLSIVALLCLTVFPAITLCMLALVEGARHGR